MKKFDYENMWYSGSQEEWLERGPAKHHHRKRVKYILEKISGFGFKRPKILDAGCGDGTITKYLAQIKGARVYGVDYNPLRIKRAKKMLPHCNFVVGDLLKLPFKNNYFDVSLSHHVLEHVKQDVKAIEELVRVTKKGGFIIIGVPNEGDIICTIRNKIIQRKIVKATDHVNFYTIKSFSKKISEVERARIVEVKGVGGCIIPHHGGHLLFARFKIFDDFFHAIAQVAPRLSNSLFFVIQKG